MKNKKIYKTIIQVNITYKLERCGNKSESVFWRNRMCNLKLAQQKSTESRKSISSNGRKKAQQINIIKLDNNKSKYLIIKIQTN